MKKKIFVTRRIPESGLDLLRSRYEVIVPDVPHPDQETLKSRIGSAHGLISLLSDKIDQEVLSACANLQVVANYAVGYNNIDVEYAKERNIWVTHTPGVLTNSTAEIAFGLMIALTRKIVQADHYTRSGEFTGWDPLLFLGDELSGKTLGIIGMGRIGCDMAGKSGAFGMKIVYHNRKPVSPNLEKQLKAAYLDLDELLRTSDVISIHTPLTSGTRHLLDEAAFAKMKKGAYIVNTARGEVIKESVLIDFLNSGHLKGAGLDVYEFEPVISPRLLKMKNVVLLPHIGSATVETRNRMSEMAALNVMAVLEGNRPENPVPEMNT